MTANLRLVGERCALIIVDMQNSYLEPEGAMAKVGLDWTRLRAAAPGCQRLLAAARKAGIPVIHTQYVFQPDFKDGGLLTREIMPELKEVGLCVKGSWDAEIWNGLKPLPNEAVIEKNRPSAFYSTQLESFLRAMQIENLVVCGITTSMCVESTVRDAAQRDFRTFVVRDATGEVVQDRYDGALKTMGFLFAKVMTVNEVLDSWKVELSNVA